ncbi:Protein-S-isoprenylcysteine O-methyltransferase Ste14 [Marinobacter daqiaonensis]|uniref:Protein-S-isoprenylcysteine O-methyltransferase Ste14 n=1 Tax=Marinobacter daqiaonensis TaxID=650891 RepID=A0A1I6JNY9_9GAMM|nr:isoprenylcysteine carboxylmethyltransferase family protein [Marinobacter daqiaonensis]SFR80678.1 Protein-S-isoprenylcysteine O-methyltransferase Ste14 [Marinobacter daqiaonensis]
MSVELFTRHFLGTFFLLIGVLFATRAMGLSARLGFSHIQYGRSGSAAWWNRQLFNIFRAAILGVCLVRMFADIDPWLGVFSWLYQPPVLLLGVFMLLCSFGLASYLQAYMHEDWRSGIAVENRPGLVTSGPYARSRNPLFLAVILGQLGFFLALPSVFSLACLVVGVWVIRRQALAEESALAESYGEPYRQYRQRVPRWL